MQDLRVLRFRRGSRVFTTLEEGEAERLRVYPTLIRRGLRVRLRVRPTVTRSLVLERSLLAVGELETTTGLGHIGMGLICERSEKW